MTMQSRNQYLHTLITQNGGYHLVGRKEKSRLLDEYCRVSGQNRKAVITKIKSGAYVHSMRKEKNEEKRSRTPTYNGEVIAYLIKLWRIFDQPSGTRLTAQVGTELARLRRLGEITCSNELATKLCAISGAQIDRRLAPHKEKEWIRGKYAKKVHPLLYQKIPTKISSQQDRSRVGNIQLDLVEHCGQKAEGAYIYTLSTTDLATNWWQSKAVITKGMQGIVCILDELKASYPFVWKEIHSDNDSAFINGHLYRYTCNEHLRFSRSRPYEKNDNYLVEQKNGRCIRRFVGYRRHDTPKELAILNELYPLLADYQNFFQPVQKLLSKELIGARVVKKFDVPKTPYQRVMEMRGTPKATKQRLTARYAALNPAELKRQIDQKQDALYRLFKTKRCQIPMAGSVKKKVPASVTFLNDLTRAASVT